MLRARLVASSYAPMLFMLGIRLAADYPIWAIICAVVGFLLVVDVLALTLRRSRLAPSPFELIAVKDETAKIPAYLLTYLFPFVFLRDVNRVDLLVYCVFFLLVVVVALNTQLVLVNPFLLMLGLHLYDVETRHGLRTLLLSAEEPRVGQTIQAVPFAAGGMKQITGGQPGGDGVD